MRVLMASMLEPDHELHCAAGGEQALHWLATERVPDLVLLDLMMPGLDGFEVLRRMRSDPRMARVPVIFGTASAGAEIAAQGLRLGAVDFVHKPLQVPVLRARVATHLELRRARELLADQNQRLTLEVHHRTLEIRLVQDASLRAMAQLGETRDNETGHHIRRTQLYVQLLAERLQHHPRFAAALAGGRMAQVIDAAPLHDIGKIAIPDRILLKPGPLDAEEMAVMKTHAAVGRTTLEQALREAQAAAAAADPAGVSEQGRAEDGPLAFLRVAADIAGCHHEHWNGAGYPDGLAGEAIPAGARIMAVADVFDAMSMPRKYKAAIPLDQVVSHVLAGSGRQFDPDVIEAFRAQLPAFGRIAREHAEPPATDP